MRSARPAPSSTRRCASGWGSTSRCQNSSGATLPGWREGDLGYSYASRRSVAEDIGDYFPATFELTIASLLLAVGVGAPLGVLSAARRGGWLDRAAGWAALVSVALPLFVIGLFFQVVFYKTLGWFPVAGRISPELGAPAR